MRPTAYSILGLLFLALVFVASNAFSDNEWYQGEITSYLQPKVSVAWDTFTASRMIGSEVRTQDGVYLAEIEDLAIDPASGHVSNVILSNIYEMGTETVAVPFSTISKSPGGEIFVYSPPEDAYQFYGQAPYWSEGFYLYANQSLPEGRVRASELIGASVHTSKGEGVAQVNDLVIDSEDGHVVYAVLFNVGGMDRMVAVPFSFLTKSGGCTFALNMTATDLENAPIFAWGDMANQKYAEDIYRHYGLRPYWTERGEMAPVTEKREWMGPRPNTSEWYQMYGY